MCLKQQQEGDFLCYFSCQNTFLHGAATGVKMDFQYVQENIAKQAWNTSRYATVQKNQKTISGITQTGAQTWGKQQYCTFFQRVGYCDCKEKKEKKSGNFVLAEATVQQK